MYGKITRGLQKEEAPMQNRIVGVLLLAFGGPDSPEAIEPFMKNLMGGRVPPPPLVEKIKARYRQIGGQSPLPGITRQQADQLAAYLENKGGKFKAAVGMRFWHPFVEEGFRQLMAAGADQIVAVSLAPFYSQVSTGTYYEEFNRVLAAWDGDKPATATTRPFYDKPAFLAAVTEKLRAGLAALSADQVRKTMVIFSAHSLPVTYIENGDPYVEQFQFTAARVADTLRLNNWRIAYQSKGGGQGQWLGPMVEEVMDEAKNEGCSDVLVVPVGFVSDHIETLYDIDIAQRAHAESLGLDFHRTASLNTADLFIQALAEAVLEKI